MLSSFFIMSISRLGQPLLRTFKSQFTHTPKPTTLIGVRAFSQSAIHQPRFSGRTFAAGIALGGAVSGAATYVLCNNKPKPTPAPAKSIESDLASRLEKYFALLDKYPDKLGVIRDAKRGELEIVRDPAI